MTTPHGYQLPTHFTFHSKLKPYSIYVITTSYTPLSTNSSITTLKVYALLITFKLPLPTFYSSSLTQVQTPFPSLIKPLIIKIHVPEHHRLKKSTSYGNDYVIIHTTRIPLSINFFSPVTSLKYPFSSSMTFTFY